MVTKIDLNQKVISKEESNTLETSKESNILTL